MEDIEVPEDERAEELKGEADAEPTPPEVPDDAPDADALEQSQPLRAVSDDRPATRWDVPEADAIEQARAVAADDDDDER